MSNEKTLSDCCEELGTIIKNDKWLRISDGEMIHSFIINLKNGETPAMALAMVKHQFELNEEAYIQ